MADLSDVEAAIVTLILGSATVSCAGLKQLGCSPVRVYRGSPPVTALTRDRMAGIVDVTVLPVADGTRNTTRWGSQAATLGVSGGLTVVVAGQTASFFGSAVAGELAGVLVNGQAFVYQAHAGDSAQLVAAALADLIRATQICWLQGASLTVPNATVLIARTAGVASVLYELGRQEQDFRISIWGTSPSTRDSVCAALGPLLATSPFLTLLDGSAGRLRYQKTASFDDDQVASIYRREFVVSVEYGTTSVVPSQTMLFGDLDYNEKSIYV